MSSPSASSDVKPVVVATTTATTQTPAIKPKTAPATVVAPAVVPAEKKVCTKSTCGQKKCKPLCCLFKLMLVGAVAGAGAVGYQLYPLLLKAKKTQDVVKLYGAIQKIYCPPVLRSPIFNFIVGQMSRYSGSVRPRFHELNYDSCTVSMDHYKSINSPVNSIHFAALMNLGELAAIMPVISQASKTGRRVVPNAARGEFFKKANGSIVAKTCNLEIPMDASSFEAEIPLKNKAGDLVAKVWITFAVGDAPAPKAK